MRSVKESRVKRFALAMMLSIAMLLTMLPTNMLSVQAAEEVDAVETDEIVVGEENEESTESADAEEFAVDDEEDISLLSAASSYTKEDGAYWACARANEGWNVDVDGYAGCQCVDLILAYYNYLVGYHVSGNAKEYATKDNLPSGWTRVYSNPQIGDIVVWGAGASIGWGTKMYADSTNGHIGIIKGVNSDGSISTVETNAEQGSAAHYYQRSAANVACYIRPNFSNSTTSRTDYLNLGDSFDSIILRTDCWKPIHVKGDNVELSTEKATADFHWHFERQSDGSYIITSLYDGRALDVTNAGTTAGTNVGVYTKWESDNGAQRWYIFGSSGAYELAPKCAMDQRLDVTGAYTADGTNIEIYTANGTAAQKFAFYSTKGKGPTSLLAVDEVTGAAIPEIRVGSTRKLTVIYNSAATAYKGVTWSSSDSSIATVSTDGTVTAKKVGYVTITATSTYNSSVKGSRTVRILSNSGLIGNWKKSGWYYYKNGEIDWSYTGLCKSGDNWCYVKNGKYDTSYTGLCKYGNAWYYVQSGILNWNYTGLCKYGNAWYYVQKGILNWNYTGLCKYGNAWYYVQKGILNWNATGLCKYGNAWYYVQKGVLNWNYTGLCKYGNAWYYVQGGILNWNYTGLCKYGNDWYYVQKGVLNWNATGLCKYGNAWYYVQKGVLNWNYTGLCAYGGSSWYVKNGKVDFSYSGTYAGKKIVSGKVQ